MQFTSWNLNADTAVGVLFFTISFQVITFERPVYYSSTVKYTHGRGTFSHGDLHIVSSWAARSAHYPALRVKIMVRRYLGKSWALYGEQSGFYVGIGTGGENPPGFGWGLRWVQYGARVEILLPCKMFYPRRGFLWVSRVSPRVTRVLDTYQTSETGSIER